MCRICDYVLANPSHPYMTICQDQEDITGQVGLRSSLPQYDVTLARNLDALWAPGYPTVGKYETVIVCMWAEDGTDKASIDKTYLSFTDAMEALDPFARCNIATCDTVRLAL